MDYNKLMAGSIPIQLSHIRPLDPRKDLLPVAELIEICFASFMDDDGREYIRHIRQAARDWRFFHSMPGANETATYPLHGYVWEEDQHVVGNLTLLPYYWQQKWFYMIVNVAVHPDYRRLGIARKLTLKGMEHVRQHGVNNAWLQVRDDNPAAVQLYTSLGFQERARRSTWISNKITTIDISPHREASISSRRKEDWEKQVSWLKSTYPPEVAWHMPFNLERFNPGFWTSLTRFLNNEEMMHWSARRNNQLIGTATWEPTRQYADTLWLAAPSENADLAITTLLPHIRNNLHSHRPLAVNYIAGRSEEAFRTAGFSLQNTLIWMEIKL